MQSRPQLRRRLEASLGYVRPHIDCYTYGYAHVYICVVHTCNRQDCYVLERNRIRERDGDSSSFRQSLLQWQAVPARARTETSLPRDGRTCAVNVREWGGGGNGPRSTDITN